MNSDLIELRDAVHAFAEERGWNGVNTPKNLAVSISIEAAELLEQLQWVSPESASDFSAEQVTAIRHEMADVLIYLIRMADKMGIDLRMATLEKLEINRKKYPVRNK